MFPVLVQGNLFPEPQLTVPDEEVVATLRAAIARAGRLARSADLLLCGLCAQYLVEELHDAAEVSRIIATVEAGDARRIGQAPCGPAQPCLTCYVIGSWPLKTSGKNAYR
jgi:hypothetical protein